MAFTTLKDVPLHQFQQIPNTAITFDGTTYPPLQPTGFGGQNFPFGNQGWITQNWSGAIWDEMNRELICAGGGHAASAWGIFFGFKLPRVGAAIGPNDFKWRRICDQPDQWTTGGKLGGNRFADYGQDYSPVQWPGWTNNIQPVAFTSSTPRTVHVAGTVDIVAGVATFNPAQTGDGAGHIPVVGDQLNYGANKIAYLRLKTSTSQWSLNSSNVPSAGIDTSINSGGPVAVNAITHFYVTRVNDQPWGAAGVEINANSDSTEPSLEFNGMTNGSYADGLPVSRHIYEGIQIIKRPRRQLFYGRGHGYPAGGDTANGPLLGDYLTPGLTNAQRWVRATQLPSMGSIDPAGFTFTWDPWGNRLIAWSGKYVAQYKLAEDGTVTTNTINVTPGGGANAPSAQTGTLSALDTRRRHIYRIARNDGGFASGQGNQIVRYRLPNGAAYPDGTQATEAITFQIDGVPVTSTHKLLSTQLQGFVYDRVNDRLIIWDPIAGETRRVLAGQLSDAVSNTINFTLIPEFLTGESPNIGPEEIIAGTYGRFALIGDGLGIVFGRYNQNVSVFRLWTPAQNQADWATRSSHAGVRMAAKFEEPQWSSTFTVANGFRFGDTTLDTDIKSSGVSSAKCRINGVGFVTTPGVRLTFTGPPTVPNYEPITGFPKSTFVTQYGSLFPDGNGRWDKGIGCEFWVQFRYYMDARTHRGFPGDGTAGTTKRKVITNLACSNGTMTVTLDSDLSVPIGSKVLGFIYGVTPSSFNTLDAIPTFFTHSATNTLTISTTLADGSTSGGFFYFTDVGMKIAILYPSDNAVRHYPSNTSPGLVMIGDPNQLSDVSNTDAYRIQQAYTGPGGGNTVPLVYNPIGTTYIQWPNDPAGAPTVYPGFAALTPPYTKIPVNQWMTFTFHVKVGHWFRGFQRPTDTTRPGLLLYGEGTHATHGAYGWGASPDPWGIGPASGHANNEIFRTSGRWDTDGVAVGARFALEIGTTALTGVTTSGSAIVTGLVSTVGLLAGMTAAATGIPSSPATTILSVDSSTQVTLNANATATGSLSITFGTSDDMFVEVTSISADGLSLFVSEVNPITFALTPLVFPATVARVGVAAIGSVTAPLYYQRPYLLPAGIATITAPDGTPGSGAVSVTAPLPLDDGDMVPITNFTNIHQDGPLTWMQLNSGSKAASGPINSHLIVRALSSDKKTVTLVTKTNSQPTVNAGRLHTIGFAKRDWRDCLVDVWYAPDGQPSKLLMSSMYVAPDGSYSTNTRLGTNLWQDEYGAMFGTIDLDAFINGLEFTVVTPDGFVYYDEIIVTDYEPFDPVATGDVAPEPSPFEAPGMPFVGGVWLL